MKWWVWVILSVVLVAAGFLGLDLRARYLEVEWTAFFAKWEAKGESFGVEANLPSGLSEEQEFVSHPWIRGIATGDPAVVARVEEMDPHTIDGYSKWKSSADEDGRLPLMPDELAERVRLHGEKFRAELDAFGEAVERPGSRLAEPSGGLWLTKVSWAGKLGAVSKLLEALSHAAIARDDSEALTRLTVLGLQAGAKLTASNSMLGLVMGAGFRSRAYDPLLSLPAARKWPESEAGKWIAAMNLNTRTAEEDFAAVLRVERGSFLQLITFQEGTPATRNAISGFPAIQRAYFAQAKLELCEELQEMVLSDRGTLRTSVDPAAWKAFCDRVSERKTESNPQKWEGAMVFTFRGIFSGLVAQGSDQAAIRAKLESEWNLKPR